VVLRNNLQSFAVQAKKKYKIFYIWTVMADPVTISQPGDSDSHVGIYPFGATLWEE